MANFVTTSLPAYVQENKDLLLKNFALIGGTRSRISVQTGVKSSAHLNFMEVAPTLQDGTACGFTSAGDVTLTQRKIETATIKINLDICPETLRGKYAEYLISTSATEDALPFESYLMEGVTNELAKRIEKLMWQGDKSKTADANLKWINGLVKIAEAEADVVDVEVTFDNMYNAIEAVYMALPEEVIERGAEIYVSPANYRKFLAEMVKKNYYHYAGAEQSAPTEFYFPGTNAKVVMTSGLAGVDVVLGTFAKNLFYGCDMEGDAEDIKVWYSDDNDVYKLKAKWNSGVQIAFPNMVVLGK